LTPLRLGTRGSSLALAQARSVATLLGDAEIVEIATAGDADRARGDKSRWTGALEAALLAGEIDLAVHSAKDVPSALAPGTEIVATPRRAEPHDVLIGERTLDDLREGARVGTSSVRRRAQLLAARPDLSVVDLRGNVDTRLRKLAEGSHDAVVLAVAGLKRLGRSEGVPMPVDVMTPAPGQGCLALEARREDARVAELAGALTDRSALVRLTAERAVVEALDATCHTPVAAYATLDGDLLSLDAFVGLPDGSSWIRDRLDGDAGAPGALGREVGARLLAAGAGELLAEAERLQTA